MCTVGERALLLFDKDTENTKCCAEFHNIQQLLQWGIGRELAQRSPALTSACPGDRLAGG